MNRRQFLSRTLLTGAAVPACVGFHLCGAYLRNHARNRGLRAPTEAPDKEAIAGITAANRDMIQWCRRLAVGQATN